MRLVICNRRIEITANTAVILLLFAISCANASSITAPPRATATSNATPQTCEFRTINYITDTLPQQCLKSAWSNLNGTASVKVAGAVNATDVGDVGGNGGSIATTSDTSISSVAPDIAVNGTWNGTVSGAVASSSSNAISTTPPHPEASTTDLENGELNEAAFLSFEEWKKQTLEKAGQKDANIGNKKSGEKRKDSESFQNNLDSLGDEGEIDLDFGAFRSGKKGDDTEKTSQSSEAKGKPKSQEKEVKKDHSRSKDAGKTCKERFSYASFDAGATIVKTHARAKNPKAILIENKDTYMLSECGANDKFVIIELSEDIWIDTLVLANYEFFSSMFRSFRVSVSDRYPVKAEKWKDLGTYEARNSRDIQAFLIENPQIWARYIRIEFLTHYGNEYYCPLSLVRVHGTRMLESWKETEASNEDEEDTEEDVPEEQLIPEAVADVIQEEERINAELKDAQAAIDELVRTAKNITTDLEPALQSSHIGDVNASLLNATIQQLTTPWIPGFDFGAWMNVSQGLDVCLPKESPVSRPKAETAQSDVLSLSTPAEMESTPMTPSATEPSSSEASFVEVTAHAMSQNETVTTPSIVSSSPNITSSIVTSSSVLSSSNISSIAKPQNTTSPVKSKTTVTSSSASALPTQQESFFKAVSRRLQLLETNSTLSLKYIEEQSRNLREAFIKVEKRQLQKTTSFLDTLNSTVLAELKDIRRQYDEIWQSTVISLESQRDESRREILAISTRLSILADEVVFQKRMSIIQSVLLLLSLGLVIFSRVSSSPLDFPSKSRIFNTFPIESPTESSPESPEYRPTNILPNGRRWVSRHHRQRSDDSMLSPEEGEYNIEQADESPPTPISSYSHSSISLTTPSQGNTSTPYLPPETTPSQPSKPTSTPSPSYENKILPISPPQKKRNANTNSPSNKSSPIRTPRKKKRFIRQQASPPIDDNYRSIPIPSTETRNEETTPASSSQTGPSQAQAIPIINTTPASPSPPPPPLRPAHANASPSRTEEGDGSRGRHRQSFSIARKPLPALPMGMEDEDGG